MTARQRRRKRQRHELLLRASFRGGDKSVVASILRRCVLVREAFVPLCGPSPGFDALPADVTKMDGIKWGVTALTSVVLCGELRAERIDGTHITLGVGDTFSTPLPEELGALPLGTSTCVVSAWSDKGDSPAEPPCVLLTLEMVAKKNRMILKRD